MKRPADILYVDDEPQELLGGVAQQQTYERFECWYPNAEPFPSIWAQCNLWVFDFYNDPKQQASPDIKGVATNGLSLFQQFRLMMDDERPPAVLASNDLEAALGSVPLDQRRHVLAEQVGVEWIVAKTSQNYDPLEEILSLADATELVYSERATLRASNPSSYVADFASSILKLPAKPGWSMGAVHGVAEWRPPVWLSPHDTPKSTTSRSGFALRPGIRSAREVIAWMLRRVLPYPSFLVRDRHVAVRLGVTIGCLRSALGAKTKIASQLKAMRYTGILAEFSGARWWAAGVDAIDWKLPRDRAQRTEKLRELFAPVPLQRLEVVDPVCVSDPDLIETDEIRSVSDCVRASDEYFPPQSAYAWVKIEDARAEDALARKVRQEDQADLTIEAVEN